MTKALTLALISALAVTPAAFAQTPAAPAAAPAAEQPLGGSVVPGVCLLSREAIFANAAVGKAASARLNELARAAQGEVDAERKPIETEVKALEGQPDNPQTRQKREALAKRWQALQDKAALASREIDATRAKALGRIAADVQPLIAQAYTAKRCGLLLDRNSALGGNFSNDLTPDVVKALDAKVQTMTFDRERLSTAPTAPAKQ